MSFIVVGGTLIAGGTVGAGVIAGGALAASAIGGGIMSKNAASANAKNIANLQYKPIDLQALQEQAQVNAKENLVKSIELEKQYMPDLSAARFGVQKQVAEDLSRGGQLPVDVQNAVTRSAMTSAGAGGFGAGPLTAAQLGLTSYDIRNQNQAKAASLAAATPLPTSGLDPGSLASAAIGQNTAQNQFNVDKTTADNQQRSASAAANASILGGLTGAFSSGYSNNWGQPALNGSPFGINTSTPSTITKSTLTSGFGMPLRK